MCFPSVSKSLNFSVSIISPSFKNIVKYLIILSTSCWDSISVSRSCRPMVPLTMLPSSMDSNMTTISCWRSKTAESSSKEFTESFESFNWSWAKTWRKPTTASHKREWARVTWFPWHGPWMYSVRELKTCFAMAIASAKCSLPLSSIVSFEE